MCRVDTDRITRYAATLGTVVSLSNLEHSPIVTYKTKSVSKEESCRTLIVAAGWWTHQLLPRISVVAKQGASFRVNGRLEQPFIEPWAPYKQIVAHQQGPEEIWIGDGTAILAHNWNEQRTIDCKRRALTSLQLKEATPVRVMLGWRPYAKTASGEPCLLQRLYKSVWAATGAGKLGTLAGGWVAHRIREVVT